MKQLAHNKLCITELYCNFRHGDYSDFNNREMLVKSYIYSEGISLKGFYQSLYQKRITFYKRNYEFNVIPFIIENENNYQLKNIVKDPNYFTLQIADVYDVEGVYITVLKTFWLRIFQRIWKNYYKKYKKHICSLGQIRFRELNGSFQKI